MKKIKKGKISFFFLLVALGVLIVSFTLPNVTKQISLGLDLKGGFEILYDVKSIHKNQPVTEDVLKNTVESLRKRIDVLGVSEPNIQIEGKNRIRVQLAGVQNQNKAREMMSTQAHLTFRDSQDKVLLDGTDLVEGKAKVTYNNMQKPVVALKLKDAKKFENVSRQLVNKPIGENLLIVWLDYQKGDSFKKEVTKKEPKYLSAPQVNQIFKTNDVTIEGNFDVKEAQKLANLLNAGSLPVELHEVYSTSISAKFGEQALHKTIVAGEIGVGLIFLFMLLYYRFPGIIAIVTLSFYMYLILVLFEAMNGVLTLPGIAAIILGVGMAVDANIIMYERIKDEIRHGRSIQAAYKVGSKKSFLTILDANVTTLIAGFVLFWLGTSSVKGFALMLIISILLSFVTSVFGTRLLLGLWVKSHVLNKKPTWFGIKEKDINEL